MSTLSQWNGSGDVRGLNSHKSNPNAADYGFTTAPAFVSGRGIKATFGRMILSPSALTIVDPFRMLTVVDEYTRECLAIHV